jgi:hypothetical protein
LPSNSLLLVFGVVFAIGAVVFGIGTSLLRTRDADESPQPSWTFDVAGGEELTPDERIELIERLALVAQPWCDELIERAAREDRDARVQRVAKRRQPGKMQT